MERCESVPRIKRGGTILGGIGNDGDRAAICGGAECTFESAPQEKFPEAAALVRTCDAELPEQKHRNALEPMHFQRASRGEIEFAIAIFVRRERVISENLRRVVDGYEDKGCRAIVARRLSRRRAEVAIDGVISALEALAIVERRIEWDDPDA